MSANGNGRAPLDIAGGLRRRELILFCRQLGVMLSAGTDILRALLVVRDQVADPQLQAALEKAHNDMTLGWTLAHTLGRHPQLFSPFFLDMIRTGESEGTLGDVMQELADYLEKQSRTELEFGAAAVSAAGPLLRPAASTFGLADRSGAYRLAVWLGLGCALSSLGWLAAALCGSAYAGIGAAVFCLGAALAAWGWGEIRRDGRRDAQGAGAQGDSGGETAASTAEPESSGSAAMASSTAVAAPHPVSTPVPGAANGKMAEPSKPVSSAPTAPPGPQPPIAGDRRKMPL